MRWLLFVVGALLSASTTSATVGSFELTGTVHAGGRPKGDAIVWLEPASGQVAAQPGKATKVVLDQRTSTFFPHVLAVQVGTTVDLPNNDRVFHNVFSFHDGKKFDLGLYPVGTIRRVTFDHARAEPHLLQHPPEHGGVRDGGRTRRTSASPTARGASRSRRCRQGPYTYHAWRAGAPEVTGATTVEAGKPLEIAWP